MSLQSNWNEKLPLDTAEIGREILAANNPYRLIGDKVNDFLTLDLFAPMYSDLGRGGICPMVLALVTVFQFLENIPDRVAAQCVVTRIDWKYALHAPLSWKGFHYSDLCNFRRRLIENGAERLVFDRVLQWVHALGFLKRHRKQRTDSTHIVGNVERMSRLELAWETLRVTLREIKATAPQWYGQVIPAVFHEVYVKRQSDWRLSKAEVKAAMQKVGQDGFWLLDRLEEGTPERVLALKEVDTFRTVWEQQFERKEGQTIVRKPPIKGKHVITSPHDPEARWSKKRSTEWVGYKLQVTETAETEKDEDEEKDEQGGESETVHFITDIDVTASNEGDSEALDEIQERLIERDLKPEEHGVDQGYVSGPNLARSAKRGIELLGPAPTSQGNKSEGYQQSDFKLDLEAQKAICPQGQESVRWKTYAAPEAPDDPDRREIKVCFGAACQGCPVRSQCTSSQSGRTLTISAFYDELSARRAEQQDEAFQQRLHWRAGVEGTLSGLVHGHGARRARYRGKTKVRLQAYFIGAAANLKRLARAMEAREKHQQQLKVGVGVSC